MNVLRTIAVLLGFALGLFVDTSFAQIPRLNESQAADYARTPETVKKFLILLDQGKIAETWDLASAHVRASSNPLLWASGIAALRSAVGPAMDRDAVEARPEQEIQGLPEGKYFLVFYETVFKNISAEEKVVLAYEAGKWKVVGYFISKRYGKSNGQ